MEKKRIKESRKQPKTGIEISRRDFLKITGVIAGVSAVSASLIYALLSKNKEESEEFKKALGEILSVLNMLYEGNEVLSLNQAVEKTGEISQMILAILKKNGIQVGSEENPQLRLMNFFKKTGYVFTISPIAVSGNSYVVNALMYKIGDTDYFDLSKLKFAGFPQSSKKVPVAAVETTLVSDIRETSYFSSGQMVFDGMTISNSQTGESTVLIFPDKIQAIAKKEGLDLEEYQKTVILNEVSHVYFSEIIPNKLLGVSLAELGIDTKGNDWKFLHVQEAFSDLASLKYGKTFDYELSRILDANNYSYEFSKAIAVASVNLGLENAGVQLRLSKNKLSDIFKSLDDNQYAIFRSTVIESYEVNIAAFYFELSKGKE